MRLASIGAHSRNLFLAAAAAAGLATLAACGARWWWLLDLATHFRAQYFVVLTIGAIVCAVTKQRAMAAVFGIGAAYNLALLVPLYGPAPANTAVEKRVRALSANVHVHNRDYQKLLNLIKASSPDIVLAMEVNSGWVEALEELAAEYPYHLVEPREDSFGIAIWSRIPTDLLEIRTIGPADVSSVLAHFDRGSDGSFTLIGTHPLPPINSDYAALRNAQLDAIGKMAANQLGPTVVAGDLNCTSWSPYFRDLLAAYGLRDSRVGFGIQPSWPGRFARFGIPIDHVLVSPGITVNSRNVGHDIGSDHRPVIIDLTVRPDDRPKRAADQN